MTIEQALQECYIHYVGEKNVALDNGDTTKAHISKKIASFCWKLRDTLNKNQTDLI